MQEFKGKVAVVTGAASGIGLGLAERAAAEGMRVVLADIERDALASATERVSAMGAETLAVPVDVSQLADIEALCARTYDRFGAVHLLCNNAGVGGGGLTWETTHEDWVWVLGVNLWSVVHAIRTFVPRMLAAGEAGHIVSTASMAGFLAAPGMSPYTATKHAVVGISECLHHELSLIGAPLRVSVLCPGWVNTRIMEAERNRPPELAHTTAPAARLQSAALQEMVRQAIASGMPPAEVAGHVFQAIRDERFWILTHPEFAAFVKNRYEAALEGRNPQILGLQ